MNEVNGENNEPDHNNASSNDYDHWRNNQPNSHSVQYAPQQQQGGQSSTQQQQQQQQQHNIMNDYLSSQNFYPQPAYMQSMPDRGPGETYFPPPQFHPAPALNSPNSPPYPMETMAGLMGASPAQSFGFGYTTFPYPHGVGAGDFNSWNYGGNQHAAASGQLGGPKTDYYREVTEHHHHILGSMHGQSQPQFISAPFDHATATLLGGPHHATPPNLRQLEQGVANLGFDHHSGGFINEGHRSGRVPSGGGAPANVGGPSKPVSWAKVASKPAKSPPPMKERRVIPIGGMAAMRPPTEAPWSIPNDAMPLGGKNGRPFGGSAMGGQKSGFGLGSRPGGGGHHQGPPDFIIQNGGGGSANGVGVGGGGIMMGLSAENGADKADAHPVLEKLRSSNEYNPRECPLNTKNARFYVIKSYSEDDIHRSIKYGIWCSTDHGNKRLDSAIKEREGKGPVYLLFSVNGSGHFCGLAQMMSSVDYGKMAGVWSQDKWKGQFQVKWIYVKDVPNNQLRHIRLENNDNKPVTNSRDTQEIPPAKGKEVCVILHKFKHSTSIFDDFSHYEKRQEDEEHGRNTGGKVRSNGRNDD